MNQKRYLGLELSGAKNAKTTIAVLEYYPKEQKVFLLDVHAGIGADATANPDEALIEIIMEHADEHPDLRLGTTAPLTLPPCMNCTRKACLAAKNCAANEVQWMKLFTAKHPAYLRGKISKKTARMRDFFTPYTQRPVELFLKGEVFSKLPEKIRFELDETLGANKAPLTARMHFLKLHLQKFELHEVLPKLTVALLSPKLKIKGTTLQHYRKLEEGVQARQAIIEKMAEGLDIFIYDRDMKKLTQNINAFDAFICAYTVLLHDRNECVNPPKGFPVSSGWVRYPKSPLLSAIPDAHLQKMMNDSEGDNEEDEEDEG